MKQRITAMINRYEVRAANPDGSEGPLLAFAEQKRMKLEEQVDFFTDERRTRRVFGRRPVIAILRRIWDFIPYLGNIWVPFVFHFDFR